MNDPTLKIKSFSFELFKYEKRRRGKARTKEGQMDAAKLKKQQQTNPKTQRD